MVKHNWQERCFGWQCGGCGVIACEEVEKQRLEQRQCQHSGKARLVLDSIGPYITVGGRRIWRTGEFLWCARCGSHTKRCIRGLGKPCKGGIARAARGQQGVRRNLAEGRLPRAKRTDAVVATPVRLTLHDWLQECGQLEEILAAKDAAEVGQILHDGEVQRCVVNSTAPEEVTLIEE